MYLDIGMIETSSVLFVSILIPRHKGELGNLCIGGLSDGITYWIAANY